MFSAKELGIDESELKMLFSEIIDDYNFNIRLKDEGKYEPSHLVDFDNFDQELSFDFDPKIEVCMETNMRNSELLELIKSEGFKEKIEIANDRLKNIGGQITETEIVMSKIHVSIKEF